MLHPYLATVRAIVRKLISFEKRMQLNLCVKLCVKFLLRGFGKLGYGIKSWITPVGVGLGPYAP